MRRLCPFAVMAMSGVVAGVVTGWPGILASVFVGLAYVLGITYAIMGD